MKILISAIILAALEFGAALMLAQFAAFGLAQYHVQSGIWGPFWLILALEGVVSAGVAAANNGSKAK